MTKTNPCKYKQNKEIEKLEAIIYYEIGKAYPLEQNGLNELIVKMGKSLETKLKAFIHKITIEEYKKGYNQCLKDQKLTGEKYQII